MHQPRRVWINLFNIIKIIGGIQMKDKEQIEPSQCSNCESLKIKYDKEAEHFECEDCGYIMKFKFNKK